MAKLTVTAAPILIFLVACAHESRGARPPATPAAPPPAVTKSAPAAEPAKAEQPAAAVSPPTESPASQADTSTAAPVIPTSPQSQPGSTAARGRPANQAPTPHPPSPVPATSTAAAAASQPSRAPAATAPSLDLNGLEQRLRDTHAIGLFTKLSLKNQVDDLLAQFKAFHQGDSRSTLGQLRQRYELLLMKVVSLLQDGDPALASAVSSSREAIWSVLTDPKKFSAI